MSLADTENRMARYIEEADGIELIQNLQFHQEEGKHEQEDRSRSTRARQLTNLAIICPDIYEKSVRIIRDYFDGEDEEDFDIAPDMDYGSHQFTFGVGSDAVGTAAAADQLRFNF